MRTAHVLVKSSKNNSLNCWNTLKLLVLKHKIEISRCECYESRKKQVNGIWLNPKC